MKGSDYQQNENNNLLSFALACMGFEEYTHIVVMQRLSDQGLCLIGGGHLSTVLRRYGGMMVESSYITPEGLLRIIVKSPSQGDGN